MLPYQGTIPVCYRSIVPHTTEPRYSVLHSHTCSTICHTPMVHVAHFYTTSVSYFTQCTLVYLYHVAVQPVYHTITQHVPLDTVCIGHCYTVNGPNCHSNPTMRQLASVTQPVLKHCHPYGSPWFSWSAQHYDPGNCPQCRCCEFKSSFYCHPLNPYVEGPTATCRWL